MESVFINGSYGIWNNQIAAVTSSLEGGTANGLNIVWYYGCLASLYQNFALSFDKGIVF